MGKQASKRDPSKPSARGKERVTLNIDAELMEWMRGEMAPGGPFGGYTHLIEFALRRLMEDKRTLQATVEAQGGRFDGDVWWAVFDQLIRDTRSVRRGPQA